MDGIKLSVSMARRQPTFEVSDQSTASWSSIGMSILGTTLLFIYILVPLFHHTNKAGYELSYRQTCTLTTLRGHFVCKKRV